MSLQCPNCGAKPGRVVDSRNKRPGSRGWYRRRRCGGCGEVYTTLECVATVTARRRGAWLPESHAEPQLAAAIAKAVEILQAAIEPEGEKP